MKHLESGKSFVKVLAPKTGDVEKHSMCILNCACAVDVVES